MGALQFHRGLVLPDPPAGDADADARPELSRPS